MLNTSAESGGRRSSAGGGARKKSLKGQGHGKPKAYKLGDTAPMNVSTFVSRILLNVCCEGISFTYFTLCVPD